MQVIGDDEEKVARIQVVSFYLGDEEYALGIEGVQEVIRLRDMTRVPKTPPSLSGVINLRGQVIPVIDGRTRLGMRPRGEDGDPRIIVVSHSGKTVGLTVDRLSEVLWISKAHLLPPPVAAGTGRQNEMIEQVAKLGERLLIFLSLEKVLGSESDRERKTSTSSAGATATGAASE